MSYIHTVKFPITPNLNSTPLFFIYTRTMMSSMGQRFTVQYTKCQGFQLCKHWKPFMHKVCVTAYNLKQVSIHGLLVRQTRKRCKKRKSCTCTSQDACTSSFVQTVNRQVYIFTLLPSHTIVVSTTLVSSFGCEFGPIGNIPSWLGSMPGTI